MSVYLCSLEKGPYFRFQKKQCKLGVLKNSVCIGGMKCLVGKKSTLKIHILELHDAFDNLVTVDTVSKYKVVPRLL